MWVICVCKPNREKLELLQTMQFPIIENAGSEYPNQLELVGIVETIELSRN